MVIAKDASPNVLELATVNVDVESVVVARATVSVLLVLVALAYTDVASWNALNDTSPAPTSVIKLPDASIVATLVLLLVYVIKPSLLLVGRVVIAKDASPNVLELATVNVASEKVDVCILVAKKTIPLLFIPSPPYTLYIKSFIITDVTFVYVPFALTWYTNDP